MKYQEVYQMIKEAAPQVRTPYEYQAKIKDRVAQDRKGFANQIKQAPFFNPSEVRTAIREADKQTARNTPGERPASKNFATSWSIFNPPEVQLAKPSTAEPLIPFRQNALRQALPYINRMKALTRLAQNTVKDPKKAEVTGSAIKNALDTVDQGKKPISQWTFNRDLINNNLKQEQTRLNAMKQLFPTFKGFWKDLVSPSSRVKSNKWFWQ